MFHGATTLLQYYSRVYTTRNFLAKFTSLGYVAATSMQCCTAMTSLALLLLTISNVASTFLQHCTVTVMMPISHLNNLS